MDLLEDLKISLLSFNFVMIYIIHKILVLLKNHLNYIKDSIFKSFFIFLNNFFFTTYNSTVCSYHVTHPFQSESLLKRENSLLKTGAKSEV